MTPSEALGKLVELSENGSLKIYEWDDSDRYGSGRWHDVEWDAPLKKKHFSEFGNQKDLNEILRNLTEGTLPQRQEQIELERKAIRLTLIAGADPNDAYLGEPIFGRFIRSRKLYGALEVARMPDFSCTIRRDDIYYTLLSHKGNDKKELVYTLFSKNMYPRTQAVFEELVPVVLEKDPDFFEKKKQVMIKRLASANSPIQLWQALYGQERER